MKKRSDIEEKFKWDISSYCKSLEDFDFQIEKILPLAKNLAKFEGQLTTGEKILQCLKLEEDFGIFVDRLSVFISLKSREDLSSAKVLEKMNKLDAILNEASPMLSFISSEINLLSDDFLNQLIKEERFFSHKRFLESVIKNKPHMLNKCEEKLLSSIGQAIGGQSEMFDMFCDVDLKFEDAVDQNGQKHPLTYSLYSKYQESGDRCLRESSMRNLNGAFGKFNHMLSSNYIQNIKTTVTFDKLRKFGNSLEAELFSEEVPATVYDTLIRGVKRNLPIFHRYFDIKRRQLGLFEMFVYDTGTSAVPLLNKTFSFEEAMNLIKMALRPLGKDYVSLIERAERERWIDVFPSENKESGAFSIVSYGQNPVVFTNFVGDLNSVFTLAHELGHAMHSYFSNSHQTYANASYTIFVAEVASNVNELLLLFFMLKNAKTDEEKIYFYDQFLSQFKGSVFRQTMFAEFEQFAHKTFENKEPISFEVLNNFYEGLLKVYFGDKVKLVSELKFEWSRIPHFYNDFYVYKYATGLISAQIIATNIFEGKSFATENYIKFLSGGNSLPPVELLKIAGVHLDEEKDFDNAYHKIEEILDEWEKLLKKKKVE